jgi:hypothetical protein
MELFWEMFQQSRIASARRDASEAKTEAASSRADVAQNSRQVRDLDYAIDRIALASQAMWELVSSRLGLTEEELREKMNEIDLRDGEADQRMTDRVIDCLGCGRKANVRRDRCIYCGATVPKPMPFQ